MAEQPTASPTEGIDFTGTSAVGCEAVAKDARGVATPLNAKSGNTVYLQRSKQLCTLWQVDKRGPDKIPVGRSYLGHEWEAYGGDLHELKFKCDNEVCSLVLPDLPNGFEYELVAFDHELPKRDEIARFLEQATYGPTREELDAFPDSFAEWVKDQQDNVELSSHRAFFREHLSWRQPYAARSGITTTPCEAEARYRRATFDNTGFMPQYEFRTDSKKRFVIYQEDGFLLTVLNATTLIVGEPDSKVKLREGS